MPLRRLTPYSSLYVQLLPTLASPRTFHRLPRVSRRWVCPLKGMKDNSLNSAVQNLSWKEGKGVVSEHFRAVSWDMAWWKETAWVVT